MKKFAVIGNPIGHSLSPVMHHANFEALRLNYSYEALNIPSNHFHHIKDIIEEKQMNGFNVTIPHKVAIMDYLDEIDVDARMIGAVNTVLIQDDKWTGYNTDGYGYIKSVDEVKNMNSVHKALVIGAGGASRAICYALIQNDVEVIVAARSPYKTQSWPFYVDAITLEEMNEQIHLYDLVVNTTPMGMTGMPGQIELDVQKTKPDCLISDIIYTPFETEFLRNARIFERPVLNGLNMFIYQGAESFKIWTAMNADEKTMRNAVISALKRREINVNE